MQTSGINRQVGKQFQFTVRSAEICRHTGRDEGGLQSAWSGRTSENCPEVIWRGGTRGILGRGSSVRESTDASEHRAFRAPAVPAGEGAAHAYTQWGGICRGWAQEGNMQPDVTAPEYLARHLSQKRRGATEVWRITWLDLWLQKNNESRRRWGKRQRDGSHFW